MNGLLNKCVIAMALSCAKEEAKILLNNVMKGRWEEVVEIYRRSGRAREAKINEAGDTALHIAVSHGLFHIIEPMVEATEDSGLKIKNERGNTALHLAAQLGDVEMCTYMVRKDKSLVAFRNLEGETPLYVAARRGNTHAFLYLKDQVSNDLWLCRKKDGDTILHAAIAGEYLDLALEIIKYYPQLVMSVNQKGQTPLHILASKPNLFKSNYYFSLVDDVIYPWISIDPTNTRHSMTGQNYPVYYTRHCMTDQKYPKNYQTGINFFQTLFTTRKREKPEMDDQENPQPKMRSHQGSLPVPPNYEMIYTCFKLAVRVFLFVLEICSSRIGQVVEIKRRDTLANQVMDELIIGASSYEYEDNGQVPKIYDPDRKRIKKGRDEFVSADVKGVLDVEAETKVDTPILIAAKKGVIEVLAKILEVFPVAIQDLDSSHKNVVLLAVENRQPHVYNFLLRRKILQENAFRQVDNQGNSALHIAAMLGNHKPWLTPGAALHMQWELKWYKFVKNSMPPHTFVSNNNKGQTPEEMFQKTHQQLVKSGSEWYCKTSEAYSVYATLIATISFSTSTNIPGGFSEDSGAPKFGDRPAFKLFSISSLLAFGFSVTSLLFFFPLLSCQFQEQDFNDLPRRLMVGLASLSASIASILISFCAGHFFVLDDNVRSAAYPIYAVTCLPVVFFLAQLPLYFRFVYTILSRIPQRGYLTNPPA